MTTSDLLVQCADGGRCVIVKIDSSNFLVCREHSDGNKEPFERVTKRVNGASGKGDEERHNRKRERKSE